MRSNAAVQGNATRAMSARAARAVIVGWALAASACGAPPAATATGASTATATATAAAGSSAILAGALTAEGWVDVTATLDPATTPVYDGDAPMSFRFLKEMRKGDVLTLSAYSMGAHSGTHVDAPMHFVANGASIDAVPLDALIGPARVIDIADSVQAITAAELERHNWRGTERVLFRTRSAHGGWMSTPAFHRDFAFIAPDAAQLLADAGVKLVGIDYISAEEFGAKAPRTHQILLGKEISIVEGLQLDRISEGDYDIVVLPIKVAGRDGAPARAIMRARNP